MWIKGAAYKPLADVWVAGLYEAYVGGTQAARKWWNCRINLQDELTRDYIYDYFNSRLDTDPARQSRTELRLRPACGGKAAKGEVRLWQLLSMMYCLAWLRYRSGAAGSVTYDASLLRVVHRRRPWLLEPNKLPTEEMYLAHMQPYILTELVPKMTAPSQILDMLKAMILDTHGVNTLPAELTLPFWPPYGASGLAGTDSNPAAVTSPFGAPPVPAPAAVEPPAATQSLPPDTSLMPAQPGLVAAQAAAQAAAQLPVAASPPAAPGLPVTVATGNCNDSDAMVVLATLFGRPFDVHSLMP